MMLEVRSMIRGSLWNALMAAVVFLPVFLVVAAAELRVRGAPPLEGEFSYHLSSAAVIYLTMLLPVLLGALVHSGAILLIPPAWSPWRRRAAAIALAALVPLTVIVLRLPGEGMLSFLVVGSAMATVIFGAACTTRLGRRGSLIMEATE
jgi:hypothetical protein